MNYKPDESTLMAYLYGELSEKDTIKLEAYFANTLTNWQVCED